MYRNLPREYTDGRREFSGYCELDPTLGISSTTVVFTGVFHKNGPPANLFFLVHGFWLSTQWIWGHFMKQYRIKHITSSASLWDIHLLLTDFWTTLRKVSYSFNMRRGILAKDFSPVRQLLQSATPPHWGTSPMVIRAIPGPTHRRIPTGNQTGSNSVLRAAIFIQLLA